MPSYSKAGCQLIDFTPRDSTAIPWVNIILNTKILEIRLDTGGHNLDSCGQNHKICIRVPGPRSQDIQHFPPKKTIIDAVVGTSVSMFTHLKVYVVVKY